MRNTPPLSDEKLVRTVGDIFRRENYGNKKAVTFVDVRPEEIRYEDVSELQAEPLVYALNLITGWMKTIGMNLLSAEGVQAALAASSLCHNPHIAWR